MSSLMVESIALPISLLGTSPIPTSLTPGRLSRDMSLLQVKPLRALGSTMEVHRWRAIVTVASHSPRDALWKDVHICLHPLASMPDWCGVLWFVLEGQWCSRRWWCVCADPAHPLGVQHLPLVFWVETLWYFHSALLYNNSISVAGKTTGMGDKRPILSLQHSLLVVPPLLILFFLYTVVW